MKSTDNIVKIVTGDGSIFYCDTDTGHMMYSTVDLEFSRRVADHVDSVGSVGVLFGIEFEGWVEYLVLYGVLEKVSIACPFRNEN